MWLFLYNLLLCLSLPAIMVYHFGRYAVGRGWDRWDERLGKCPTAQQGVVRFWIHAVSGGEMAAAGPIILKLRERFPDCQMLLTTATAAGKKIAEKYTDRHTLVCYFPLDLWWSVHRALNRFKPHVVITLEKEFWPNFFHASSQRGAVLALANGSISQRTWSRTKRLRGFYTWMLRHLDILAMQTATDAQRIQEMGAPEDRVFVAGNTKFDEFSHSDPVDVNALRTKLGYQADDEIWVAGSTNQGEEEAILEAHRLLMKTRPGLSLVVAPRDIKRAEEVAALVRSEGFTPRQRSEENPKGESDVLILDTFGELGAVYAVGEFAFVGGTLIPKGGHNLLQPIAHGKKVFFGPHVFKTKDIAEMLAAAGVGEMVHSGRELAERAALLLDQPSLKTEVCTKALQLMSENRGTASRIVDLIAPRLTGNAER